MTGWHKLGTRLNLLFYIGMYNVHDSSTSIVLKYIDWKLKKIV